jgi:hypothetical protein
MNGFIEVKPAVSKDEKAIDDPLLIRPALLSGFD